MSQPPSSGSHPRGRVPFSQPVEIRYPLFQDFIRETASNISLGGMFISTAKPLAVGAEFDFEISLDAGPSLIGGRAKVAWVRDDEDPEQGPIGMGVSFLQLERDCLELVRRIVEQQMAQGEERFDLLEAAVLGPAPGARFSKDAGQALGRRGSRFAYWFSVVALSVAVGGLMMFSFDHYYVRPRIEALQHQVAARGTASLEQQPQLSASAPARAESEDPATPENSDPLQAVRAWVAAWEEQRVDDYLGSYATSFQPSNGRTREEWAALRAERVARQSNVRLDVTLAEVETSGATERRVTFVQSYASDTYRDRVRKILRLVWEDGGWRIVEERVIRGSG